MARKRSTKQEGTVSESELASAYTGHQKLGTTSGSVGSAPSKPGNPGTGMGVKSGKPGRMSQGGDGGSGCAAGRARTNRGKNSTTAGPQGFKG